MVQSSDHGAVRMLVIAELGYVADMAGRQLARPQDGKMIAGVCAGLANRFGVSTTLVRIAFVLFGLVGAGELVYIALWILLPKE